MKQTEMHSNKTILRVLFAAAVVLLFCGAAVGAVGAEAADHTHAGVTFTTPWGSNSSEQTSLPSTSGSYYLTNDVTLSGIWNVPNGETTLCLNGSVIKMTGNGCVIRISSGAKLNLYDCGTTLHYFTVDSDGLWKLATDQTTPTDYFVTGGCITGGTGDNGSGGGVKVSGGTFTLYGGNIVGNTANVGGGVYIRDSGSFTMNNGCIIGNTAKDGYGGGVNVQKGSFTMTGGTISKNTATNDGGGVRVTANGTFNVSGSPIIKDNTKVSGGTSNNDNVCLTNATQLQLVDLLTGGEIRITKVNSSSPSVGDPFGNANLSTGGGAGHFVADGNTPLIGSIGTDTEGNNILVWKNAGSWEGNVFIPNPNGYATVKDFAEALNNDPSNPIAQYDDSTKTVKLLKDVALGGTLKLGGDSENSFILDLGGKTLSRNNDSDYFSVITVESGKYLTLNDSSEDKSGKITGGKAENGGAVYVGSGGDFTMEGGNITGNTASGNGGGVYVGIGGSFTMSAGTIGGTGAGDGNTATSGGGVFVDLGGTFNVSESPVISGNTNGGAADNVYLEDTTRLQLTGPLTGGEIRITKIDSADPKAGKQFGMTTLSAGSGEEYFKADGANLVGSIEVADPENKLVWIVGELTVTFDMQGHGAQIDDQKVTPGGKVTEPLAPSAEGYTFGGWYTDSGCAEDTKWDFATTVEKNMTLFAKWTANKYTITLSQDGVDEGGTESVIVTYDSSVITPAIRNPVKHGYSLDGWYMNDKEVIGENGQFVPDVEGYTDAQGRWKHDGNITLTAVLIPNEKVVIPDPGEPAIIEAETIPNPETGSLVKVVSADNVSYVLFDADTQGLKNPGTDASGYRLVKTYTVYQMTAEAVSGNVVQVTIRAELQEGDNPNNVILRHYTGTYDSGRWSGRWDSTPIHSEFIRELTDPEDKPYTHEFVFNVSKFSPFALTYENPVKKSSGSSGGASVWLTETQVPTLTPTPTPTPTVTPTPGQGEPSVKPLPSETPATPVPFMGILAGLGCAAAVLAVRMRR